MNRLAQATSPYLLQHAANPVDWHPWGDEAFAKARVEGKPVLLSIGYSACHWCHVMAHESFEDADVAAAMNRDFVSVKVDREERPDVDQVYQTAHALMTRRGGGWPLTVFMTPDGEPFFAGTYFPKHARHGLPGFLELLPHVARVYREKGEAIAAQGAELRRALAALEPERQGDALPADATRRALDDLRSTFDSTHGGFGQAPKFPNVADLEFALEAHLRDPDPGVLAIAALSARKMAEGGLHDQLGGGFCRYATDREWQVPHFEKMLYDNGPLLGLYADLYAVTGERVFAQAAEGIVAWLVREMRASDGAFFSSLDADSEGEEGRYYVWTREEVGAVLDAGEYAVAAAHFGLDGAPNFEGRWHLRVAQRIEDVASRLGLDVSTAQARLDASRAKLLDAREQRVRPGLDDKILTAWNALAIAGLARASRRLARDDWLALAFDAADALKRTAWRNGRLLATRRGESAQLPAYLDDHAFLLAALLELMESRFRIDDYRWARELADLMLAQFADPRDGGFFFTSHDHEALIHRSKPGHDNATPSGNAVAARALVTLGHLAAEPSYVDAAHAAATLFAPQFVHAPRGFSTMIGALPAFRTPPTSVLLTGDTATTSQWHAALTRAPRPGVRVFNAGGLDLPPELRKGSAGDRAVAWICRGTACLPPVDRYEAIAELARESP